MMHPTLFLDQNREFEKQSKLADDKAKADLIANTPAKIGARISGPLFGEAPRQLTLARPQDQSDKHRPEGN